MKCYIVGCEKELVPPIKRFMGRAVCSDCWNELNTIAEKIELRNANNQNAV